MKNTGKEYEEFVFDKFKMMFHFYDVRMNEKMLGNESKINRQIDISVRGKVDNNLDFLYIVQCKDHNKPADIKIIGEFSAVIKDVGASKGYLVCASGFTKTIHTYAKNLGIELITLHDLHSEKWKVDVTIPIVYIYKDLQLGTSPALKITNELAEIFKNDTYISHEDAKYISFDNGNTAIPILDFLNDYLVKNNIEMKGNFEINFENEKMLLRILNCWAPCTLKFVVNITEIYYLKYITPLDWAQMNNHLTNESTPIMFGIPSNSHLLDDTFIKIDKDDVPVRTMVRMEIEENLLPLSSINFAFGDLTADKL